MVIEIDATHARRAADVTASLRGCEDTAVYLTLEDPTFYGFLLQRKLTEGWFPRYSFSCSQLFGRGAKTIRVAPGQRLIPGGMEEARAAILPNHGYVLDPGVYRYSLILATDDPKKTNQPVTCTMISSVEFEAEEEDIHARDPTAHRKNGTSLGKSARSD
jgi:hypothetical protein